MLNETQKANLYAVFVSPTTGLFTYINDEDVLPSIALKVFKFLQNLVEAMLDNKPAIVMPEDLKSELKKLEILETVESIEKIILHEYPQNRTENYPYMDSHPDPSMIVYKGSDDRPAFEKKGMLSLTANNDKTTDHVTKADVLRYLREQMHNQVLLCENRELTNRVNQLENNIQILPGEKDVKDKNENEVWFETPDDELGFVLNDHSELKKAVLNQPDVLLLHTSNIIRDINLDIRKSEFHSIDALGMIKLFLEDLGRLVDYCNQFNIAWNSQLEVLENKLKDIVISEDNLNILSACCSVLDKAGRALAYYTEENPDNQQVKSLQQHISKAHNYLISLFGAYWNLHKKEGERPLCQYE